MFKIALFFSLAIIATGISMALPAPVRDGKSTTTDAADCEYPKSMVLVRLWVFKYRTEIPWNCAWIRLKFHHGIPDYNGGIPETGSPGQPTKVRAGYVPAGCATLAETVKAAAETFLPKEERDKMRTEGLFMDSVMHTQLSPLIEAAKFKEFIAVLYLEEKEPEKTTTTTTKAPQRSYYGGYYG